MLGRHERHDCLHDQCQPLQPIATRAMTAWEHFAEVGLVGAVLGHLDCQTKEHTQQ